MRRCLGRTVLAAVAGLTACLSPAHSKPVTDCPNRDAPFSAKSPLIDLLLSPAARAIVDREMGGRLEKSSSPFFRTTTPSFASIITLEQALRFTGMKPETVAALDQELRKLPVTDSDKVARCTRYDNEVPRFDLSAGRPRLLLFEKINGFKDEPSVNAANAAIRALAKRKGWAIAVTDKAGVFNPRSLRQFDAVIWNNISGDVLTLSQRSAFETWMNKGGGYVGVHGSAGDPQYFWDWYADSLVGARFIGHPSNPQFQEARIATDTAHPLAHGLPAEWRMTDEWYSFKASPRRSGAQVILTLDESTYKADDGARDLRMGDHPIAWTRCIGRGRMFYSAIGHRPETYSDARYVTLLENAIEWASTDRNACRKKPA